MYPQTLKYSSSTSRADKAYSTSLNSSNQKTFPGQNDELACLQSSHRRYKLAHSQAQKLSKQGLESLTKKLQHLRLTTNENSEQNIKQLKHSQSIGSKNYRIKKDKLIKLTQKKSLHLQIISFDLNFEENLWKKQPQSKLNADLITKTADLITNNLDVICFQIHDTKLDVHFRSEFTYETLNKQLKFIFQNVEQFFQYITQQNKNYVNDNEGINTKVGVNFDLKSLNLQILVRFKTLIKGQYNDQKEKLINIPLLPFAMVQIVEDHHFEDSEKTELKQQIYSINNQLQLSKQEITSLKAQNHKLNQKISLIESQIHRQKTQKLILIENYEKMSLESQTSKQFFFSFVPDPKAKNTLSFTLKNQIFKKTKNDLKWDQVSSQTPLPKARRHYFSFNIKSIVPDFMFGIVTRKGKDTLNAFLGLQTICLYASRNSCYIYERGRHYKISSSVKNGDIVFVIVDREKSIIQWIKRKQQLSQDRQNYQEQKQTKVAINSNFHQINSSVNHKFQEAIDKLSQSSIKDRKNSEQLSTQDLPNKSILNRISGLGHDFEYLHSVTIPQQMAQHELYAYVQIYNINDPLKLNQKK